MKSKIVPMLICLIALSALLAGCAKSDPSASAAASASPGTEASASPSAAVSASAEPSPAVSAEPTPAVSVAPDGFIMGTVKAISGNSITLTTVNPAGEKTITADSNTKYTVSGSLKSATLADIAVGDVITATLNGTTALIIIDNGKTVNPDPSAYYTPSPSPSPSPSVSPSPSK